MEYLLLFVCVTSGSVVGYFIARKLDKKRSRTVVTRVVMPEPIVEPEELAERLYASLGDMSKHPL